MQKILSLSFQDRSSLPRTKHFYTQSILSFLHRHLLHSLDQVERDTFTYYAILFVFWVLVHKMPNPFCRRPEFARCALADQVEIPRHLAANLDIHVDARQVTFHQRDQTRESVALFPLSVHDLVNRH